MRTEILNQRDAELWDRVVDQSINGSLFHKWTWLKIMEKYTHSQLFPLVFFDNDTNDPFGAVPIFYTKKMGIKMVFSPPPGTGVRLGPLIVDKGFKQHEFELAYLAFQDSMDKFLKTLGPHYTLLITTPGLADVRPFSWSGYEISPLYTYQIDLKAGQDTIWKNMSKSLRWEIQQAKKNNLRVVESPDLTGMLYVHQSLARRYADQNLKSMLNYDYLQDIFTQMGRSAVKVYLAMYNEKIVGATVYTFYKNTIVSWMGGARNDPGDVTAGHYLDWEVLSKAIQEGYQLYEDFGANTRHLCNSKAKFCPEPRLYFQLCKADILSSYLERLYRNVIKRKQLITI